VLFIGAGVSAPAPSSLPLFDELARRVGEGTGMPRRDDESVDRYFGRLKLRGVQVHKAVASILLDPNSRPHELHTLLTKLFFTGHPGTTCHDELRYTSVDSPRAAFRIVSRYVLCACAAAWG
jgi:hypothetical protein